MHKVRRATRIEEKGVKERIARRLPEVGVTL
jgi:hypothetical protein